MNVDVVLFSAATEISWLRFVTALETLRISQPPIAEAVGLDRLDALQAIAKLWRHHSVMADTSTDSEQPQGILALVDRFSAYHCSDARDHIFAVYSLAPNIQPAEREESESRYKRSQAVYMDIDYSVDVQQTYYSFALACTKNGSARVILEAALSRRNSPLPEGWRSWVPDWRSPRSPSTALHHCDFDAINCKLVSPDVLRLSTRHMRCGRHSGACPATVVTTAVIGDETSFDSLLSFLTNLIRSCPKRFLEPLLRKLLGEPNVYASHVTPLKTHFSATQTPSAASAEQRMRFVQTMVESTEDRCLFVATAPSRFNELETYVGFGNAKMQIGDQLAIVVLFTSSLTNCQGTDPWSVLILRPIREISKDGFTHRLIGIGYMSPPIDSWPCSGAYSYWGPVETVIHLV
jgi:hypothetical protein